MRDLFYRHRAFIILYLCVVTISLIAYFLRPSPLQTIEQDLYDLRFSIVRRHPSDKVVIVAVDERSIDEYGRWPWPRSLIKDLIEKILKQDVAVLGLDIVFSEASLDKKADQDLANLIEEYGNVVTGYFFRLKSHGRPPPEASLKALHYARIKLIKGKPISVYEFPFVEPNIPEVQTASLYSGFFNFFPDGDGLYRRINLLALYKGEVYPSLALATLQTYYDEDALVRFDPYGLRTIVLAEREIPARMDGSISLNFYGPKGTFRYVSASQVLHGKVRDLKNKIVLLGITEMGLADLRPTPVDATLPGVALHATFISNFLKGEFIRRPLWAGAIEVLYILFTPFVIILLARRRSLSIWVGFLVCIFLTEGLNLYLFKTRFIHLEQVWSILAEVLGLVSSQAYRSLVLQRKARQIKQAFSSYLAPEVVEMVIEDPDMLSLGGQKRHLTCLFLDIRGFTSLSEKIPPTEIVSILNELLGPFTDIVLKNRGMLDKYIGDAMMALFNVPLEVPDHADRAILSGLEILQRLKEINRQWVKDGRPRISVGIGINTGDAIVGNMGTTVRFDYTAIGDTINTASRLEGLSKYYGVSLIVSETTVAETRREFDLLKLDYVRVKGRESPLWIYTVLEEDDIQIKGLYEEALEAFFQKDFERALKILDRIQSPPVFVQTFREKVISTAKGPLPEDWDGVTNFQTK